MFSSLSCPEFRRLESRLHRRELLQLGGLGALGLGLTDLLAARNLAAKERPGHPHSEFSDALGFGKAKACIVMFMWGGPSHIDTWDLKPQAPSEVRGEFRPIDTNVAGVQISEHFPHLARHADQYAIVRSVTHDDPAHLSSVHHIMTGRHAPQVKSDAVPPSRKDSPHVGSVLSKLRATEGAVPPFITMPWTVMHPAAPGGTAPGQHAGWLGTAYDPFLVAGDPNAADFQVSGLKLIDGVSPIRVDARRALLSGLDGAAGSSFGGLQQRAFDMLTSAEVNRAFDIASEPAEVRERYGRNIHGQCLLLARRLIEAGTSLVCVNWHQDHRNFWDTHGDNFRRLKRDLMPPTDQGFSALLEDLSARGMLDETLLVWVGEFGRRPEITRENAGRDHWPWCASAVFAGGGIRGGQTFGRSDSQGGRPAENPVSPADLTATIYHALGIPADLLLNDRENRPQRVTEGNPIGQLFV
ncbi:MAG TPA: DUF1501 domain-containing protein [Planctomycetaceae bacterium]|nr:DUF1501 domain-containing protein [Planctomycetaceae bacterium]